MRAVQKTIGLLADSDATVLILGETGTSALQARFGGTVPFTGVGAGLTSLSFARICGPLVLASVPLMVIVGTVYDGAMHAFSAFDRR